MATCLGFCSFVLPLTSGSTSSLQKTKDTTEPLLRSDTIWVEQGQKGCKIGDEDFTTALDCAFGKALNYTATSHRPILIRLTEGVFDTARGLQMSPNNGVSVSIEGSGKGEFGGGTVLRQIRPTANAVVYYPYLRTNMASGFWSDLHLKGFTIDAGALAPACFDLEALRVAHLQDLSCTGATGQQSWVRIGALPTKYGGNVPDGYNGAAFQVMASDIFVYHNGMEPESEIRAHLSHGSVSGFEIVKPGHFRESDNVAVLIKGPYNGTPPCKVMPQELSGHVVPDPEHPEFHRLVSISQRGGGKDCSDNLSVIAVDMPAAKYGFEIFATDSSFYDLTDDSVGRYAGISDRGSDRTMFVHAHVWNTWGGLELWGGESVISPELDSIYGYGIRFRWGKGTVVLNPTFVYLHKPVYGDMVQYLFDPDATNMTIAAEACGIVDPNLGHRQFAWSDHHATDLGYGTLTVFDGHELQPRALPFGLRTSGLSLCSDSQAPHVLKGISASLSEAGSERRVFWSAIHTTENPASLLVAELPSVRKPPAMPSLRITTVASEDDGKLAEQSFNVAEMRSGLRNGGCAQGVTHRQPVGVSLYKDDTHFVKVYLTVKPNTGVSVSISMVNDPEIHLEGLPVSKNPSGVLFCTSF